MICIVRFYHTLSDISVHLNSRAFVGLGYPSQCGRGFLYVTALTSVLFLFFWYFRVCGVGGLNIGFPVLPRFIYG